MRRAKAIAMISGGLDSTLALALMLRQGVEVKAVNFYTGFCVTETQRRKGGRPDGTIPRNEALRAAADLEVEIEYVDISGAGYLDMLVHPRYGYGANANPCVDCRIFMMRKAKEIMEAEGADFVFTGEVLGQRPKSQRRDTLRTIERESGLEGRLLRPLSAKLLAPTIPEREGIVDRARLEAISGRSRPRRSNVLTIPISPSQWSRWKWVMKIAPTSGSPIERSSCCWVPSPQSNKDISPLRSSATPERLRCGAGMAEPVPRNTRSIIKYSYLNFATKREPQRTKRSESKFHSILL